MTPPFIPPDPDARPAPPAEFADALIAFLPNLRRYALSLCRRGDLADDLVQITVERAFAAGGPPDGLNRLQAWLLRILRNAWIDMTRRSATRGVEADIDDMPEAASIDGRTTVETRLMLQAALSAVDELPPDQREVMLLVCVEGLSYAEAAAILEVPQGTVMSRLSRARLAVATRLGIK